MAQLFTREYMYLWMAVLAALLYLPVRQFIWVLQVRRAQKKTGEVDAHEQNRLKRRAGMTSAMLCLMFSYFYITKVLFAN